MVHKTFFFILKISLSLLLIAYVLGRIHLPDVIKELGTLNWGYLLLACCVLFIQFLLSAYRWNVTLSTLGAHLPWKMVFRINWTALFFNQALPASIGGDATRVWFLHRRGHPAMTTISSILIGHIGMITGLILISLLGLGILLQNPTPLNPRLLFLYWFVPLLLLCTALGTLLLCLFGHYFPKPIPTLAKHVKIMLSQPKQFFVFSILSVLSCLLLIVQSYLLGLALHLPVTWMSFISLMPLVLLASVLPISIGGWGPREATTILLFGYVGISSSASFTLSILVAFCTIFVSLPGAIFYLLDHHKPETQA
jgi:uncharacterized membrane protein YbhN (UPF0104 family)